MHVNARETVPLKLIKLTGRSKLICIHLFFINLVKVSARDKRGALTLLNLINAVEVFVV